MFYVPLDLPLLLLPDGVHLVASLMIKSWCILKMCPVHHHLIRFIPVDIGTVFAIF